MKTHYSLLMSESLLLFLALAGFFLFLFRGHAGKTSATELHRVRNISRALKAMLLIYLFGLPLLVIALGRTSWVVGGTTYSSFSAIPTAAKLIPILPVSVYLLMAITFYRLLNLYEKGVFFSKQNVRLFRMLGYLVFCKGLINVVIPVVYSGALEFPDLLFRFFGSPWIIGGLFGIMISFIMDEGCKLREDRELTI